MRRDAITCNSAISACEKACEWQRALGLLAEIVERTVQQDAITCNSAIRACGMSEEWQRASGLVAEMAKMTVQQDSTVMCSGRLPGKTMHMPKWRRCKLGVRRLRTTMPGNLAYV